MTTYKLNDSKMFSDITDGIAIIINSETGIYYGMNGLGTIVYENIEKGADTDKILSKLKEMGAPATIDANFKQFIDAMVEKEILKEAAGTGAEVSIDEKVAKEDNFALAMKEYNDAQELLLADPIHEVKEETAEREKKMEK